MRALSPLSLLLLLGSCGHQDAFPGGATDPLGPPSNGIPRQLTYSLGDDLSPTWFGDGSALVYSYVNELSGADRCLGILPAAGGTRVTQKCLQGDLAHDTVQQLLWPSPGPEGRTGAWVDTRRFRAHLSPDAAYLRVGELASGDTGAAVMSIPRLAPSGRLYFLATHIGWLGSSRLVFVGSDVLYPSDAVVGLEVALLDFSVTPAKLSVVPTTDGATSVWAASDESSIYYTIAGDTRVYRQVLATGEVTIPHDFAGSGVPGDISIRDRYLTAVVNGGFGVGRRLVRVDLLTGNSDVLQSLVGPVEQGALAPDGRHVVAGLRGGPETAPNRDLWLLAFP